MDIYVHGHGNFDTRHGYTTVPQGFRVSFYTHFAKTFSQSTMAEIFYGDGVTPERTIGEYSSVPNLIYSPLNTDDQQLNAMRYARSLARNPTKRFATFNSPMTLEVILQNLSRQMDGQIKLSNARQRAQHLEGDPAKGFVEVHWLACQAVNLQKVSTTLGVNAQDMRHNLQHPDSYRMTWTAGGLEHERFVRISGHHT